MMKKSDVTDMCFLSPMQEGMLFHYLMDKESTAYFEQMTYRISGEIDCKLFEQALSRLIERYEVLRTIFIYEKVKKPLQVVLKRRNPSVYYEDISHLDKNEKIKHIKDFKIKDREIGFDLSADMLIRFSILKMGDQEYEVIWSFHHIIMDGWCTAILTKELLLIYQHLKAGGSLNLPPVQPFRNYIKWLEKQDKEAGLHYWKNYLADYETPAVIHGNIKANKKKYQTALHLFNIDQTFTTELREISHENQVTLNTIFQALWGILLQKYNDSSDVVFGSVVSGRPAELEGIETMIGLFINIMPVRIKSNPGETFVSLLKKVQAQMLLSQLHDYIPLAEIQSNCPLKRNLVNHIIVFENYPLDKEILNLSRQTSQDFFVKSVEAFEQTNYDLNVRACLEEELEIEVNYNSTVYPLDVIKRIENHLVRIIRQVRADPEVLLSETEIISNLEKQQILMDFNQTRTQYPANKTICQLFAEVVERNPHHTALMGVHESHEAHRKNHNMSHMSHMSYMSYKELNEKSQQLAYRLKDKGVQPDKIVGIMTEPSLDRVIGILGVLQAGGAYLPIDPRYPRERILYMLKDSGAKILVTTPVLVEKIEKLLIVNCQLLIANEMPPNRRRLNNPPKEANLINNYQLTINNLQLKGNNLAYVIYTSGSTGRPKGTPVQHRSLNNLCHWHNKHFSGTPHDRTAQYAGFGFDASVWEILPYLIAGTTIYMIEEDIKSDLYRLNQFFEKNQITIAFIPTQVCELFMTLENTSLRLLLTGGDKLKRFIKQDYQLVNNYGPTENTVVTTSFFVNEEYENIPIGKPIDNVFVYILDQHMHLQPPGIPGELCIAGMSLAPGYLNQPELTKERFCLRRPGGALFEKTAPPGPPCKNFLLKDKKVPGKKREKSYVRLEGTRGLAPLSPGKNPMQPCIHASMPSLHHPITPIPHFPIYHTGDLTRWLPDGNIEFLGRIDYQVKVRGVRIELEEIEQLLCTHKSIEDCAVVSRKLNEENQLIAYYKIFLTDQLGIEGEITGSELQEFLAAKLPDYMIPSCFVQLDALPLLSNGKIDRKSLPEPGEQTNKNYEAPGNDLERILAGIWQEVLGIKKIGVNDNFFQMGGDSIKVIQIASRLINHRLKLETRDLFAHPTIKQLGPCIKVIDRLTPQHTVEGEVKLTPVQHYFSRVHHQDRHLYNQVVTIYKSTGFEEKILKKIFAKLVEHHDALRMRFTYTADENRLIQWNKGMEENLFHLDIINIKTETQKNIQAQIQEKTSALLEKINLETGPLLAVGLFKTIIGDYLVIIIHHLVMDTISWRILFEDFSSLYQQIQKGKNITLPLKTTSFKEWAEKLYEYANSEELLKELTYWKKLEQTTVPPLPTDKKRTINQDKTKHARSQSWELSREYTQKLLKQVNRAYNTDINDILLAALALAVRKWTGAEKILISLEGHGREEIIKDINISRTLGWFTSIYPVILEIKNPNNTGSVIKETKEIIRQIPNKGIGYGILKYLTKKEKKPDTHFNLQPEISFNYLGQFDEHLEADNDLFQQVDIPLGYTSGFTNPNGPNLDIVGIVLNRTFILTLTYDTEVYQDLTIKTFMAHFQKALEKIIDHCTAKKESEITLSDLSSSRVDAGELEAMFDALEEMNLEK